MVILYERKLDREFARFIRLGLRGLRGMTQLDTQPLFTQPRYKENFENLTPIQSSLKLESTRVCVYTKPYFMSTLLNPRTLTTEKIITKTWLNGKYSLRNLSE